MSNITNLITNIRKAVFGKDVRESIASAIEQTYQDATASGNANMEVSEARGTFDTLNKRLNNSDSVKADKTTTTDLQNQINVEKARIDNIANLDEGSTTGDAELQDIRVGADGESYTNAGDAVRSQISGISEIVKKLFIEEVSQTIKLGAYQINNSGIEQSSVLWVSSEKYIKVSDYEQITIVLPENYVYKLAYYDERKEWIRTDTSITQNNIIQLNMKELDCAYIRFSARYLDETTHADINSITLYSLTSISKNQLEQFMKQIASLENNNTLEVLNYFERGTLSASGSNSTSILALRNSKIIDVSNFAKIGVTKFKAPENYNMRIFYYDSNNSFIKRTDSSNEIYFDGTSNYIKIIIFSQNINFIDINKFYEIKIKNVKNINIEYELTRQSINADGVYVDNATTSVAVKNYLKTIPGKIYRLKINEGFFITTFLNNKLIRIHQQLVDIIAEEDNMPIAIRRNDLTTIDVSDLDEIGLTITQIDDIKYDKEYDCIVAAYNSSEKDKEKATYICDGINDEIEIEAAINYGAYNGKINNNVLLLPGDYIIDNFKKVYNKNHDEGYGFSSCVMQLANGIVDNRSVKLCGLNFHEYIQKYATTRILLSQNGYNSVSNNNEDYSIIGALRYGQNNMGILAHKFALKIENIFISKYDVEKPIIGIDGVGCSQFSAENVTVSYDYLKDNKTTDIELFFDLVNIPEGSIGIRYGHGSNKGCGNYLKHCRVVGSYEGFANCGEHYITEDCLAHHCKIGFTDGNYAVKPMLEHPNVYIGCSIEQCERIAVLNRYGAIEGSEVSTPEKTIVWIGGSTEAYWKDSLGNNHLMLPIKEIVKGAYRGRIEMDYCGENVPIFEEGSGDSIIAISY